MCFFLCFMCFVCLVCSFFVSLTQARPGLKGFDWLLDLDSFTVSLFKEMNTEHSVMQYLFTFLCTSTDTQIVLRIWKFNCCNRSKYTYIIIGVSVSVIHVFTVHTDKNIVRMYSHVLILQLKEIRQVSNQLVRKVLL